MMAKTICYLLVAVIFFSACSDKPIPAKELAGVSAEDTTTHFEYEPAVSVLHGTLFLAAYEGDFAIAETGEPDSLAVETAYVLMLDKPIDITAPAVDNSGGFDVAQTNVSRIQLVPAIDAQQYLNRKVKITGKLWGAQTVHHHTPVLISVDEIIAAD
ncbi:MAG TPA: DUF4431 domain-containing protein [Chitinophagales bacterium]|nr:DUF4431 domain-containing protein [Chitinophagales bacterium]